MMLNIFDFTKLFLASLDSSTSDSIMKCFSYIFINAITGICLTNAYPALSLPCVEAVSGGRPGVAQGPTEGIV